MVTREVTSSTTTVPRMDAQREFISAHSDSTDLVVQVYVPVGGDFGILIPAPAQPTIDSNPVPASDLDALDAATRPQVTVQTVKTVPSSGGGGCGGSKGVLGIEPTGSTQPDTGVRTGTTVTVGPVNATPIQATDANALNGWLSQNGFVIPAAYQSVVDQYVGNGQWFVALKPSGQGTAGVSVGVHFSVPVVHKEMELQLAQLGASPQMAFTAFVFDASAVGPDNAAGLTLHDLDPSLLAISYAQAVRSAVNAHGGKAWVAEGTFPSSVATGALAPLVDPQATLTRLSTVVSSDQLTYDATFNGSPPPNVTNTITVQVEQNTAWIFPWTGNRSGGSGAGGSGGSRDPFSGAGPGAIALLCAALFLRSFKLRTA